MKLPDIHLLQAAIMLAEVRNYSRAAKKLGVQQPTLTKRILELEHLVGFQLFLRTTQYVEPTDTCRQFVEEAKHCIFHAERALHVARMAEKGAQTVLHVGKSQYTDPYLVSVLTAISLPLYPNLELSFSSLSCPDLETEVLLGKLDFALAIGHFEHPKITQLELMDTPFYVVMPESSELALYKELSLEHLNGMRWILYERHAHPALYDEVLRKTRQAGTIPGNIRHVITPDEAAQELYEGNGDIALLTRAGAWKVARQGLTMRPLLNAELSISSKLIARADNASKLLSEFARTMKRKLEGSRRVQLNLPLTG